MSTTKLLLDDEYSRIELEDGIIIATWKNNFINISVAKHVVEQRLKAANGVKYPFLIKIKSIRDTTKEARDFLASKQGCEGLTAAAILAESVLENMIANFFIYLNKPLVPTKIFKDEKKALEWLANYTRKTS